MPSLQEKIGEDIKDAMRKKEEVRLGTLRMLKSDLQYEMTKTGAQALEDEIVMKIMRTAIKKRNDAKEQFEKGDRPELAAKEAAEIAVLETYLPANVSEDVIRKKAQEIIAEVKPQGPQDLGKVMGKVMAAFKGQSVDGTTVNKIVKSLLGG
ncbi:MAG: GatB/YqeY domain-containing protein [Leptospirales bacterium]|nr:GatB/YqeY domain-containing protein [Leptospirales bacterium]